MSESRYNLNALRSKKSELERLRNQLRTYRNDFLMTTGRLGASWEGPAKDTYVNTVQQIMAKVDDFIDGITKYINALDQIIINRERAESKNQQTAH